MGKEIVGAGGRPLSMNKKTIDTGQAPKDKDIEAARKLRKELEKEERLLNQKVTRKEVIDLVSDLEAEYSAQMRMLFVQVKTLTDVIVAKGISTIDELDELSKPVLENLYGKPKDIEKQEKK